MTANGVDSKMDGLKLTADGPSASKAESAAPTQKPQKQDKERKDQKVAAKGKQNPQQTAPKKKAGEVSEWSGKL